MVSTSSYVHDATYQMKLKCSKETRENDLVWILGFHENVEIAKEFIDRDAATRIRILILAANYKE